MMCRTIFRRILAASALVALALGLATEARAAQPITVTVLANGELPGIRGADLQTYLAKAMASAGGNWHFDLASTGRAAPPDRIEWSFKPNASASSSVRSFGFSSAAMQRLLGTRHYLTIEATLYLGGEYQTQTIGEVSVLGGTSDQDLAAEIARDTRQLIAYTMLDTRSELSSRLSPRRI